MSSDYDTTNVKRADPLTVEQRVGILEESVKRLQWYAAKNGLALKHDYDHAMWKELNVKKPERTPEDVAVTVLAGLLVAWVLIATAGYFFIGGG